MLAMAKGYYNGSQIVLDTPVDFEMGQEVVVTYTVLPAKKRAEDVSSLVDSLVGAIPDSGKSLAAYREERLAKYARAD